MTIRWTEEQYKQFMNQKGSEKTSFDSLSLKESVKNENNSLKSVMSSLIQENINSSDSENKKTKKSKNINELIEKLEVKNNNEKHIIFDEISKKSKKKNNVLDIIKNTTPQIIIDEEKCLIWWDNLRLYTLNEIFALLQVQPYLVFFYKKMLNKKIKDAMLLNYPQKVYSNKKEAWFDFPVMIELFRSHKKLFDNDGFPAAFKYLTDSLKKDGVNLIREDDPKIVVGYKIHQSINSGTAVGMLIRKATIQEIESQKERDIKKEWFDLFKN